LLFLQKTATPSKTISNDPFAQATSPSSKGFDVGRVLKTVEDDLDEVGIHNPQRLAQGLSIALSIQNATDGGDEISLALLLQGRQHWL
jgi:hypothetical protein